MSATKSNDSSRRFSEASETAISELKALEVHLGVFLDTTHANIDRLAQQKALLLAQKRASPLFKTQLGPKRQIRDRVRAYDAGQEVLHAFEKLQHEAFSLGRDNQQYKARLSEQHKVMLMQMEMITYLETLLKTKVIHQELQLLQDMLAMAASSDREVFQNDHKESQYSMAYVQSTANPIACSGNGKDICG